MRILAIAQPAPARTGQDDSFREYVAGLAGEPARYGPVVGRGARERLGRELPSHDALGATAALDRSQQGFIVGGINHYRDAVVVLGRSADHGRTAYVDLLDAGSEV